MRFQATELRTKVTYLVTRSLHQTSPGSFPPVCQPHHTTFIQSRNSAAEYSSKLSRKPTTTETLGANK